MLKFHTKNKSVVFNEKTVELIENNYTELFNKLFYTDNLSVSSEVITFICKPYTVTIKGKFDENIQKLTKYAFYGSVDETTLKVKSISIMDRDI